MLKCKCLCKNLYLDVVNESFLRHSLGLVRNVGAKSCWMRRTLSESVANVACQYLKEKQTSLTLILTICSKTLSPPLLLSCCIKSLSCVSICLWTMNSGVSNSGVIVLSRPRQTVVVCCCLYVTLRFCWDCLF